MSGLFASMRAQMVAAYMTGGMPEADALMVADLALHAADRAANAVAAVIETAPVPLSWSVATGALSLASQLFKNRLDDMIEQAEASGQRLAVATITPGSMQ